jgi:hypothetical protein
LRRDDFLKMTVAITKGHSLSVHDVIDYVAHVAGGVHMGSPRTEKQRVMGELQNRLPFMNLSVVAVTLRAIGRVILAGLRELKSCVLNLDRFENSPGISIYAALAIFPMPGGQENYVFDVGVEQNRNRASVFIDAHGELCLRVFGSSGATKTLRAGGPGYAYRFGEAMYLGCEMGRCGDETLVSMDSDGWELSHVLCGVQEPSFTQPLHHVIGSDVTGRSRSNIAVMELVVVLNIPSNENRSNIREYLADKLAIGYKAAVRYEMSAPHHSQGHPNFPTTEGKGHVQ